MLYTYTAGDANGTRQDGEFEGDNERQVIQYLTSHGLQPISIRASGSTKRIFFAGKITLEDKIFITRYLSLMLKVGTDLLSAVNILITDFDKPVVKNFLLQVRGNLSRGQPFFQTFANYPNAFSKVFVSLVRAAESSGNLQETFEQLSTSLFKESELRKRIKAAFIYPIILLVISVVIFIFLSVFALPKIAAVFQDAGVDPPSFSKIVFAFGLFVNANIWAILFTFIVLGVSGYLFFRKTLVGKNFMDQMLQNMPIVKNVYRDIAIERFASTYASLIKAGLPIIEATKITAEVVGSSRLRDGLIRIADSGLSRGLTIGESFRKEAVFPSVVTNLVAISEKAGHLEEVLETLSEFYTSNVDNSIRTLVAFIEPILLLGMGLLVATIALAIIVPIYQLTSNF